MQKYTLLLFLFLSAFTIMAQEQVLTEKFKSEPGERTFNRGDLTSKTLESATQDFDGDGKPDVMQVVMSGGSTMIFTVLASSSQEELGFKVEIDGIIEFEKIKFWGLFDLDGAGEPELFILEDELKICQFRGDKALLWFEIQFFAGAFDVDGDGLTDLIQFDQDLRQTTILGFGATINLNPKQEEVISVVKSKNDFQLITKYESRDTLDIGFEEVSLESLSDLDANNDGNTDIILIRENEAGESTRIRVINGKNGNAALNLSLPGDEDIAKGFRGFFDVDSDGRKEAYLGDRTLIDQDGNLSKLPEDFEIFGFLDIDGDDNKDILGYNTTNNKVTVLGTPTATSTNDSWARKLGITIHPNFPNPVQASTTFKFEIEDSQRVRLDILHLNGQLINSLLDENISAGVHYVDWNANNLPAGMYLYRFSIGGGSITKALVKQ